MIHTDRFRILTDEDKVRYIPSLCERCCFYYNCELINEYLIKQIQNNKTSTSLRVEAKVSTSDENKNETIPKAPASNEKKPNPVVKSIAIDDTKSNLFKQTDYVVVTGVLKAVIVKDSNLIEQTDPVETLPFYMREIWEDGKCPLKEGYGIECGNQWVANGLNCDFKINLVRDYKYDGTEPYKIDRSSYRRNHETNKWEPRQPVIISAPTGCGKNTFVEQDLTKHIRELNHRYRTNYRILIIDNRRALLEQNRDRVESGFTEDDKIYYNYKDYVDVISYQSVMRQAEHLKRIQKQGLTKYLYVICDEAHFFTSDAPFNPDTEKILETIIQIFSKAIRVYMTATPYECLKFIKDKEYQRDKSKPAVIYHFRRDYSYLNAKCFSNETELIDIITNSVVNYNEKWLIFIDNIKKIEAFKKQLEYRDGSETALKDKVMTVDANSKFKDKKYQEMIISENFVKDINVVIATSVVDNGVNFRNVDNIVITDINRTKCIQMLGRVRVDRNPTTRAYLGEVTMYIKRHNANFITKRLKDTGIQQDAYHDYDMMLKTTHDEWKFQDKYKDSERRDWENSKHWFGRCKKEPDKLYLNNIARSLADKNIQIYESILKEMEATDKDNKTTGQKYLEYQLSWFGKKYSEENDITLNGYKTDGQLELERWLHSEWLNKKISKDMQKSFGKDFFERYNPIFGLCTKKQGFDTDDNRGEKGPKAVGYYSIKRINEIFRVRKMPFTIVEDNDYCIVIQATI